MKRLFILAVFLCNLINAQNPIFGGGGGGGSSTPGISNLQIVAGNPNAAGTTGVAPSASNLSIVFDSADSTFWYYDGTSWILLSTTIGTGPFTISGATGTVSTGVAASRPSCALDNLYYATDTKVLTQGSTVTGACVTLNPSGYIAVVFDTTAKTIVTYGPSDSGGTITTMGSTTIVHSIGATFNGGGSALTNGTTAGTSLLYTAPIPFACTVTAWTITVDAGTIGFRVWKIADGTAIPTVSNTLNSADLAISTGTNLKSTTMTNFTGGTAPSIAIGDIIAFQLNAATTAKYAAVSLQCQ